MLKALDGSGIRGEYRRTGKAEEMIFLKALDYRRVHIAELRAVAFIKYDDHMLLIDGMYGILFYEGRKLLYSCNDDAALVIFKLPFEDSSGSVAVRRTLFKAVILLHGLVVEILAVDHEKHLVDIGKPGGKPCGLEARQRLA